MRCCFDNQPLYIVHMDFRILALSGGGYRGLYTAQVLAGLEEESGLPLHRRFDLIAGTSIGGVLALAIASGKTSMKEAVDLMKCQGTSIFGTKGPPESKIGKLLDYARHRGSARYDPKPIKKLISKFVGADTYIGDLKQKVIIPSVNVTKGSPQVFKTPHHENFVRDWKLTLVDVALATSAAPSFFPLHTIGNERFADGGMFANSPDELALHEAQHFLEQDIRNIHVLSIGTTTSKFSFPGSVSSNLGWWGWLENQRMISTMISAQQMQADFIMRHRLGQRYSRVDTTPSASQLSAITLDNASGGVVNDLLGLAEGSLRDNLQGIRNAGFFDHEVPEENFLDNEKISNHFRKLRE